MEMPQSQFSFYRDLTAFTDFAEVSEVQRYQKVPDDWCLILSDIRGSTKAIQSGNYKNVNLIGAATITAYINVAGTSEVPFVFGGDGATLLVPSDCAPKLLTELRRIKRMAMEEFQIELRVASISIATLEQLNQDVFVAKFQLSPRNYLAQFRGGGLSFAETLMKTNDPKIQILEAADDEDYHSKASDPLRGLSCRLTPLRSLRGEMLTVLCKPKGSEATQIALIKEVIEQFSAILNHNLSKGSPVNASNVSWPLLPRTVTTEAKMQMKGSFVFRWLWSATNSLIANLSLNFNFPLGAFRPKKYKAELPLNSDSKKFDETLRMVLDCSAEEIARLIEILERLHRANKLVYGIHRSATALMTCVAYDPSNNGHIHFIDGADGGYALAALQLKKQMQG